MCLSGNKVDSRRGHSSLQEMVSRVHYRHLGLLAFHGSLIDHLAGILTEELTAIKNYCKIYIK